MKQIILILLMLFFTGNLFAQKSSSNKTLDLDFFSTASVGYSNTERLTIERYDTEADGFKVGIDGFARFFKTFVVGAQFETSMWFLDGDEDDIHALTLAPAVGLHYGELSGFQVFCYATVGPSYAMTGDEQMVVTSSGFHFGFGVNRVLFEYAKQTIYNLIYHNITLRIHLGKLD